MRIKSFSYYEVTTKRINFHHFFHRVLLASSHLVETYSEPHHGEIGTNECAHNTYTASSTKKTLPKGKRIDYILYRSGENYEVND